MQPSPYSPVRPSSLNAIERALDLYGEEFARVHGFYSQHGYCYSEPEALVLFRPCLRERFWEVNPASPDCWWVELAIGEKAPAIFARIVPWSLPYVGWQRGARNDLKPRFFPFTKAKALYELQGRFSPSSARPS